MAQNEAGHSGEHVVGIFRNGYQAELAIDRLIDAGFSADSIERLRRDDAEVQKVLQEARTQPARAARDLSTGIGGTLVEGVGGVTGTLVDWGLPEDEARSFASGVREGDVLVAVWCGNQCERAQFILAELGAEVPRR